MVNKVSGLLGISAKAGKTVCGMDSVLEEISKSHVKLVIVARRFIRKNNKKHKILL